MKIFFTVAHQTLTTPYRSMIVSRSQDYLRAVFSFTDDWYGTQKIAQFVRGELKYNIMLDAVNSCLVPWEILQNEGEFTVTVWGNNYPDKDNIVITANKLSIMVYRDGLDDELLPKDPTVGVEGGLLTQCQEYAESAQESAAAAAVSEGNAHDSELAAKASEDAALLSEQHAKASEDAALLSEQHAKASEDAAALSEQHAKASEDAALLSEQHAKTSETNAGNSASAAHASELAAAASAAVLANSPHFEFDNGDLYLVYTS